MLNKSVPVFAGQKELLGLWLAETEGAKFWLSVLTELKTRGGHCGRMGHETSDDVPAGEEPAPQHPGECNSLPRAVSIDGQCHDLIVAHRCTHAVKGATLFTADVTAFSAFRSSYCPELSFDRSSSRATSDVSPPAD